MHSSCLCCKLVIDDTSQYELKGVIYYLPQPWSRNPYITHHLVGNNMAIASACIPDYNTSHQTFYQITIWNHQAERMINPFIEGNWDNMSLTCKNRYVYQKMKKNQAERIWTKKRGHILNPGNRALKCNNCIDKSSKMSNNMRRAHQTALKHKA